MESIGIVNSPFTSIENMPIQPKGAKDVVGTIDIYEPYIEGFRDLDGFSHIYLLYFFHKAKKTALTVTPFMDTVKRGVYSTRSPLRPNHIGLSIVELVSIKQGVITVKGIDLLNGTPLFDVKPYIESFDLVEKSRSGWMKANMDEVAEKRSDERFK
ncbi:MAG: tRNA (N6-threonylcarbamoyladenosine(37)-N6)-methyltransferase TrmO [Thermodesulfobacteriota bacterium]|nr:tRNA (N6-threonylcarbamoyladenosine(37)-N6)-methyltransferase TrmO [Thermodesulfobacteriota bacterium]